MPGFDNVYVLAATSALLDQSVMVICRAEELLTDWPRRLPERTSPLDGLILADGRFGWSVNWRAFFLTSRAKSVKLDLFLTKSVLAIFFIYNS